MGARALVVGRTGYGDEAIRGALEGAFINASMAREIEELRRKALLWDMHWELESKKRQTILDKVDLYRKSHARKSRNVFQKFWNLLVVKEVD